MPQTGKSFANRASNAANKKAATAVAEEGAAALSEVFNKGSKTIEDLKKVWDRLHDDVLYMTDTPLLRKLLSSK